MIDLRLWEYRATLYRYVDGDSCWLILDQGMRDRTEEEVRLAGVRAPEKAQPGGPETSAFVRQWFAVTLSSGLRWPLYVRTEPNTNPEPEERRTFTRYVATVWDIRDLSRCLNDDVDAFLAGHPEWGPGQV